MDKRFYNSIYGLVVSGKYKAYKEAKEHLYELGLATRPQRPLYRYSVYAMGTGWSAYQCKGVYTDWETANHHGECLADNPNYAEVIVVSEGYLFSKSVMVYK